MLRPSFAARAPTDVKEKEKSASAEILIVLEGRDETSITANKQDK
jgi:hypothetical protein